MKVIPFFIIFVINLKTGIMKQKQLDREDVIKLFSLEEDNLGPTEEYTDNDFNNFLSDYVGKTLEEYSKHRFPDNPQEQFKLAVGVLSV